MFNWFFKKLDSSKKVESKVDVEEISRINWALDTNANLKDGFNQLALQYGELSEKEYIERSLALLKQEGISLTKDELRRLLIVRRQTDKMLQEEKLEKDICKKQQEIVK